MEYNNLTLQEAVRLVFLASRYKRGLTQNGLSIISNITRQFISQIEIGKRQPSIFTLCALANAYNVPLSEFFAEVDKLYPLLANENFQPTSDTLHASESNKIATAYIKNAKKKCHRKRK
jgi:transcriptional regulator with XRE-family HTH domain